MRRRRRTRSAIRVRLLPAFGTETTKGVAWAEHRDGDGPQFGEGVLAGVLVSGFASTAHATTPAPPPGAPAVESAPSSLTGLSPELPPDVIAASAAPGSTWTPESAVYGTGSVNDIAVPGAGGTTIRVNEIYPTLASGAPAPGKFPVLLTMTPYGKGQGGSSAPGSASAPGGGSPTGGADNYLVQRGYIEVVMDVRGAGDSNGQWGLFDPVQQTDAIKVLDWAARLHNSTGSVGTYGPSYLGIDQLLLAGAVGKKSPLKAIFPLVSANDIYRDTSFMGGLLDFEFSETYLGLTGGLNTITPAEDTATDPELLTDLAGIETDHLNGLASYHAATTLNVLSGGDEAYDGTYWGNETRPTFWRRSSPTTSPRTCSEASSTSSRMESHSTTQLYRMPTTTARPPTPCCPVNA